jgi:DNA polymerase-3 subunit epsilon
MADTPWLDTQYDVDYPRNCAGRSLIYLAGFHGMVNPFPHRAITDVLTMLTILARYEIKQVIANSQRKWLIVQANVSYDERDKAKGKGFRWQSDGSKTYEKRWVKRVSEEQLATLQTDCDFNLTVLERL